MVSSSFCAVFEGVLSVPQPVNDKAPISSAAKISDVHYIIPFFEKYAELFAIPSPFIHVFNDGNPLSSGDGFSIFRNVQAIFDKVGERGE